MCRNTYIGGMLFLYPLSLAQSPRAFDHSRRFSTVRTPNHVWNDIRNQLSLDLTCFEELEGQFSRMACHVPYSLPEEPWYLNMPAKSLELSDNESLPVGIPADVPNGDERKSTFV